MMKTINIAAILCLSAFFMNSCTNSESGPEKPLPSISVRAESVVEGKIEEYLTLNGKVIYLKKDKIVTPISAFVTRVNVHYGEIVKQGEVLFELQTRESKALSNNTSDIKVIAPTGGTVSEMMVNQPGTYMTEGDVLCMVVENKDRMIQVNVPYEYHNLMKPGAGCRVLLPDQTEFSATVATILPEISETDQTQKILLKPESKRALPENLNLSVRFIQNSNSRSLLVSRDAVMCNEKQTDFWLMKVFNDSIAVKIPVEKGMENDSMVEIISSNIIPGDLIITVGAYGLPDSSIVKLIN